MPQAKWSQEPSLTTKGGTKIFQVYDFLHDKHFTQKVILQHSLIFQIVFLCTLLFLVLCFCCFFDNFPLFANHSLTFPDWSSPKFKDRDQFETGRISSNGKLQFLLVMYTPNYQAKHFFIFDQDHTGTRLSTTLLSQVEELTQILLLHHFVLLLHFVFLLHYLFPPLNDHHMCPAV